MRTAAGVEAGTISERFHQRAHHRSRELAREHGADTIIVAVSSDGLGAVLADVVPRVRPDADWVIATKGWQPETLQSPCDILASLLGSSDRIVSLAGPGLAPEMLDRFLGEQDD